jgi:hypothetical protein
MGGNRAFRDGEASKRGNFFEVQATFSGHKRGFEAATIEGVVMILWAGIRSVAAG